MKEDTKLYSLRRQVWSWGDAYVAYQGDEVQEIYKIGSPTFSWRKEINMTDMDDRPIIHARGQGHWFSFCFDVFNPNDELVGTIIQDSVWSTRNYTAQAPNGKEYKVNANFMRSVFSISLDGQTILTAQRNVWKFAHKYTINISSTIPDGEHVYLLFILAAMDIIIVIQGSN